MTDDAAVEPREALQGMTAQQLDAELSRAEDELADVDEMRRFTLGQTGVHIGAARLRSLHATWNRDETRLQERIRLLRDLRGVSDGSNLPAIWPRAEECGAP